MRRLRHWLSKLLLTLCGHADVLPGVLRQAESGTAVYNSVKEKKERVGRMVQMHSNSREEIKEVLAGDIAAAVGLKDVTTGDTLCDLDSHCA